MVTVPSVFTTRSFSTSTSNIGNVLVSDPTAGSAIIGSAYDDTKELRDKIDKIENLFFQKVVVKCKWCGQYGAALCECKHCGQAIDYDEFK